MKLVNDSSSNIIKKVSFTQTLSILKLKDNYVEALKPLLLDEEPSIFIPSVRLTVEDVPEFIKAVQMAAMIASGELETG